MRAVISILAATVRGGWGIAAMPVKRAFDLAAAAAALLLLALPMLILALLVKISSPGRAFYRQVRVGRHRREFRLVKFRTMRSGADQQGAQVTARGDARITRLGSFLRRTKLDELPELWNVLRGELSLVGPRPEVPRYVAQYPPDWELVFSVRPGITDLATLQFRDEEAVLAGAADAERAYLEVIVPIKMRLALEYVARRSLGLDLKILWLTVWGITLGRRWAKPSTDLADEARRRIRALDS